MILYDPEIDLVVKTARAFRPHGIPFENKAEFLLIRGGRREERKLHALFEPIGRVFCDSNVVKSFAFARGSLRFAVSHGDNAHEFFAFFKARRLFYGALAEGERRPAGIQSQRLRLQYQPLSVIPRPLLKIVGLFARDRKVARNARKLPVPREKALKCFGLVLHEADRKPALPIARLRLLF